MIGTERAARGDTGGEEIVPTAVAGVVDVVVVDFGAVVDVKVAAVVAVAFVDEADTDAVA